MRLCLAGALALIAATHAHADPRFTDRAGALGAEHVYSGGWEHFVGGGVAVFDCDGDGWPEIAAAGGASPSRLFRNLADPDLAFSPGDFPALTGVTGIYPAEIDGDGIGDLLVLRAGGNVLLKGGPDCAFTPMGRGFEGGDGWSTAASLTWEGENLLPTIAIGNYVDRTDPDGPFEACDENELHRPDGETYGPPTLLSPGFCALSILFSDWNRDGTADLRLSNDRHYYVRGGAEQMYSLRENRFLGPEDGWDGPSIWGMGIASRDLTGDGLPEIVLTSMGDQLMMIAGQDGYTLAPYSIGTFAHRPFQGDDGRPSTGWHAAFGDVDNDGRDDLFIAKGNVDQMPSNAMADPNNLLVQKADGTFEERAAQAGIATTDRARGAALADLNRDGRLDLVVVNRRAPMELWRNDTERTGAWVALLPRQPAPNTDAVGAWIELEREGAPTAFREITVGGGHVGDTRGPLHFGLGDADTARARVIWPDGAISPWVVVEAGGEVALERIDAAGGVRLAPIP
ncbi:CRTAC1 family protein [Roseicyclus sp. F158]|uniref:CRTAC1 family protein n=1 Tax=Tropicimonas omnivorans TaxID=3075590 RepID=A0ABU3DFM8_9RHOB|nr:CRTAC1 family protein [Roseicyclus sp. F158]MDT0682487.1 CRTAC1 family protein [Roseicyclus sp. F158]